MSDRRVQVGSGSTLNYYAADVVSAQDYYPLGMLQPGRIFNAGGYRYGFNGQEKSAEINADGNSMTAEYWEYDARTGRRWNLDPVVKKWESPYLCFSGNPVFYSDPKGDVVKPGKHLGRKKDLNDEEKKKVLQGISVMTDDKLEWGKNGSLKIVAYNNKGGKSNGTKVVRLLIKSRHTLYIDLNEGIIGGWTDVDNKAEEANSSDGKTGANSRSAIGSPHPIFVDKGNGIVTKESMSFSDIINHEFIHALAFLYGGVMPGNKIRVNTFFTNEGTLKKELVDNEEFVTTFGGRPDREADPRTNEPKLKYPSENDLRYEQQRGARLNYNTLKYPNRVEQYTADEWKDYLEQKVR